MCTLISSLKLLLISAIEKPLISHDEPENNRDPCEDPCVTCFDKLASLEMIGSLRPKIFLLVKKMTDATNSEAAVFDGLSVANQVTNFTNV